MREDRSPILELQGITKSFGGVEALRGVDFALHASEIHGLVGENGAGKSTLVKVLCGFHQPDAGEIRFNGNTVRIADPQHARRLGINVVHQECVVFDNLSVAENIFIGARPRRRESPISRPSSRAAVADSSAFSGAPAAMSLYAVQSHVRAWPEALLPS